MREILDPADYGLWLDPRAEVNGLLALLRPFLAESMIAIPLSPILPPRSSLGVVPDDNNLDHVSTLPLPS